ncbi:MAG: hypothetical protein IJQ68_06550 [Methanobrevibacter sp.]|uniref:hypothetical protein n=1 Tax=Methanobrevibacter sp. TaxID=66852 RepID=UPI0025D60AF7|nr:hypothetical protein [Methanobrevibacter sp.]MBR0271631.1 hypothetical protein [Methanobrevibacter sp.]
MARLIELNEKIVAQNDEIIRLLLKLSGEDKQKENGNPSIDKANIGFDVDVDESGEVVVRPNSSGEKTAKKAEKKDKSLFDLNITTKSGESLDDMELDAGEVLFIGNCDDGSADIFKMSVKNSDELKVFPPEIEAEIRSNLSDYNCEIVIDNLTGDGITHQYGVPLILANESLIQNSVIGSGTVILDDESFDNLSDIIQLAMENGAKEVHLSLKNAMAVINAPPKLLEYLEFYRNYEQIFDNVM